MFPRLVCNQKPMLTPQLSMGDGLSNQFLQGNPSADPKLLAISYHLVNFFVGVG